MNVEDYIRERHDCQVEARQAAHAYLRQPTAATWAGFKAAEDRAREAEAALWRAVDRHARERGLAS